MNMRILALIVALLLPLTTKAFLTPEQNMKLPTADIEKKLSDEPPQSYYMYAARQFIETRAIG
jgi:hypothetical protein